MIDIQILQTVSIVIASAGVFVAAIYYVLQIRYPTRIRQTNIILRVLLHANTNEQSDTKLKFYTTEFKDYNDFVKKYGPMFAETPVHAAFGLVGNYFDAVGVLAQRKLVDINLVSDMWGPAVNMVWQRIKPSAEGLRKEYKSPLIYAPLEYLYNEIHKREQQLASKTA